MDMKLLYLPNPEAICAVLSPGTSGKASVTALGAKGQASALCCHSLTGSEAYLLCPAFISSLILVVNPAEVGYDHRDWQGNDQDTAQGADGAKYLSRDCLGYHVSISGRERE